MKKYDGYLFEKEFDPYQDMFLRDLEGMWRSLIENNSKKTKLTLDQAFREMEDEWSKEKKR